MAYNKKPPTNKKKGKYQAAGARRLSTTEEEVRSGTPRANAAKNAKARAAAKERNTDKFKASATSGSNAMAILNQDEFVSSRRAAASPNKASSVAKVMGATKVTKKATGAKTEPKKGTYAYAKKQNSDLDEWITRRNNSTKGTAEYNKAQNAINTAYGKGPTTRNTVEKKIDTIKIKPLESKLIESSKEVTWEKKPKEDTPKKVVAETSVKKDTPKARVTPSGGSGMGAVEREKQRIADITAAPTVKKSKTSASKASTPKSGISPSGGSGMGAINKIKNALSDLIPNSSSTKPKDRRGKRTAKRVKRLQNRLSKALGKD